MDFSDINRNDNSFGITGAEFGAFGELSRVVNGGHGSGNFGHSGRPGEVGGSGSGYGASGSGENAKVEKQIDQAGYKAAAGHGMEEYLKSSKKAAFDVEFDEFKEYLSSSDQRIYDKSGKRSYALKDVAKKLGGAGLKSVFKKLQIAAARSQSSGMDYQLVGGYLSDIQELEKKLK